MLSSPSPRVFLRNFSCGRALRATTFQVGDSVVLKAAGTATSPKKQRKLDTARNKPIFIHALTPSGEHKTDQGIVSHDEIIGKKQRGTIFTKKNDEKSKKRIYLNGKLQHVDNGEPALFRAFKPTLSEYTFLTDRLTVPIHPADSNLIVSLLDFHIDTLEHDESKAPTIEILDSGTGHGGMALQLARAIHGANDPLTRNQRDFFFSRGRQQDEIHEHLSQDLARWKEQRRAVVHSVEINPTYSARGKLNVQGFRRGMYAGDVEFYVASVEKWIEGQFKQRAEKAGRSAEERVPFLDHILLDMPGSYEKVEIASEALRENGNLVLFCPSITQLVKAAQIIREKNLRLVQHQILQTGPVSTGGQEWELTLLKPRSKVKIEGLTSRSNSDSDVESAEQSSEDSKPLSDVEYQQVLAEARREQDRLAAAESESETDVRQLEIVCKPKVGVMTAMSGFVGIWQKKA